MFFSLSLPPLSLLLLKRPSQQLWIAVLPKIQTKELSCPSFLFWPPSPGLAVDINWFVRTHFFILLVCGHVGQLNFLYKNLTAGTGQPGPDSLDSWPEHDGKDEREDLTGQPGQVS
jgi:hypothetical protein